MAEIISMENNKIVFARPYNFENETYTEIDMQGLYDLKAKDLTEIDRIFTSRGNNPAMSGLTLEYAVLVAHKVTGKPIEFFEGLPAKDATALKNRVIIFFYGED